MAKAEKPKSASQAVRDLIAEGVTDTADIIAEAENRWKMTVSKPTVYNIKSSGKAKKKKAKAKPKAKAKATAKKGLLKMLSRHSRGWSISRAWKEPGSCSTSWKR